MVNWVGNSLGYEEDMGYRKDTGHNTCIFHEPWNFEINK